MKSRWGKNKETELGKDQAQGTHTDNKHNAYFLLLHVTASFGGNLEFASLL